MKYQTVGSESGSYGNLTMGRGRAGQFKRSRVHPLNPQSTAQTAVREVLSSVAARWRSLGDAAMASWDNFAEAKGMVQKGFNAFTMVNALNVQGGNPVVLAPPAVASFGIFTATGLPESLSSARRGARVFPVPEPSALSLPCSDSRLTRARATTAVLVSTATHDAVRRPFLSPAGAKRLRHRSAHRRKLSKMAEKCRLMPEAGFDNLASCVVGSKTNGSWVDWVNFTYSGPIGFMDLLALDTTNKFYRAISP